MQLNYELANCSAQTWKKLISALQMGGKRYALHTIQTKRGRHLPDYNPL